MANSPSGRPVRGTAGDALRVLATDTAAVTGDGFFTALVAALAGFFGSKYAFVTECTDSAFTHVRTLAFHADGHPAENIEYEMAETPCERVMTGGSCYYPTGLSDRFPNQDGMMSYLGVLVTGSAGNALGHLAIAHDEPMACGPRDVTNLGIFAARAGMELERKRGDEALRAANARLTEALDEIRALRDRLADERSYLQEEILADRAPGDMLGDSAPMRELSSQIARVGATDSTTLITGETGSGKELVARAIHASSSRSDRALVKVNAAAIAGGLVESELFGHEKGAFTGATARRVGRFELADGGTLFLDEIGELPPPAQATLLRVLEEGAFERVGSSHTLTVDVRVIAATNRDLTRAVETGEFRTDLYHRLNVVPIVVPPLRHRATDVPRLARHFFERSCRRAGRALRGISEDAMSRLVAYSWPGNVRELANVVERAVVLSSEPVLGAAAFHLPGADDRVGPTGPVPAPDADGIAGPRPLALDDVERRHIVHVLNEADGVVAGAGGAAELLGLPPSTLRSRMKKLGISASRARAQVR
ncbi:sigma 54-interacting transcriptional regulator [Candidatus Poribacteria bacterium]|jgi:formate hydrogenlyase transcriptional activator|nr:sigma 54-interacting transcriptional regulator [Candidatus Poribacteria bacterium]MBT5711592.1 sigma 54-interacting transcriptional regulator [Candidatus Poribacteria bacterium]MBT7096490.1 sigma 54-interacting transcriptional regulator [Candidatus Poribacteria bacterium]MBT7805976.1 sigma 54-interacting transcriptional regulator [Candidatus Poribacteria bacterium]